MSTSDALSEAVARGSGLVLSLPSPGGLSHHKSKFLSDGPEGIWAELPQAVELIDAAIASKAPVGVTYRTNAVREVFATTLLRRGDCLGRLQGVSTPAVLMARPAKIKPVQRRAHFRVRVQPDSGLTLDCWIIARHADIRERPLPSQRVKVQVLDISLGGAGILVLPGGAKSTGLTFDDRLRVQVKMNDIELLVEGRVRTADSISDGVTKTGIRFHFLENGLDERLKVSQLARIIAQLELRQVKAIRRQTEDCQLTTCDAAEPQTLSNS